MGKTISKAILLIADISGYTEFMLNNKTTLYHSQVIISDLLETILHEIDLPLKVAKLEGDAVFFYGLDSGKLKDVVHAKLLLFFEAFYRKLYFLSDTNRCDCYACLHMKKLKLKLFVHHGSVMFQKVGTYMELFGPDIVLIHRLLKNSIKHNQYIYLTEEAQKFLEYEIKYHKEFHVEDVADIGAQHGIVFDLDNEDFDLIEYEYHDYKTATVMGINVKKMMKSMCRRVLSKTITTHEHNY